LARDNIESLKGLCPLLMQFIVKSSGIGELRCGQRSLVSLTTTGYDWE